MMTSCFSRKLRYVGLYLHTLPASVNKTILNIWSVDLIWLLFSCLFCVLWPNWFCPFMFKHRGISYVHWKLKIGLSLKKIKPNLWINLLYLYYSYETTTWSGISEDLKKMSRLHETVKHAYQNVQFYSSRNNSLLCQSVICTPQFQIQTPHTADHGGICNWVHHDTI
jgi:hypothetical protein